MRYFRNKVLPYLSPIKNADGAYLEYGNVIVVENIIIGCLDGVNICGRKR